MSRLNDLLRRLEAKDPDLAKDLRREVDALADRRAFGLNFERHVPEAVELPGRPVRKGDKVRILPPRGSNPSDGDDRLWRVTSIAKDGDDTRTASLSLLGGDETAESAVDDLVVVAEFRDPIYPGLASTGKVERGGDKPFHTVINAENFHALQTLLFTHRGKVDCIYVDPPYNTGGKTSWLYNDKYVDKDDHFRHSKWLAFIERRLLIARELLSPAGVIFVSIDDAEQHRLRMLLDQIFDETNFVDTLAVEMSTTSGPKTVNAQQGTIVKNVEFVHIYRKSARFDTVRHTPLLDGIELYDTHYTLWIHKDGSLGSLAEQMMSDPTVSQEIERLNLANRGRFSVNQMDKLLAVSGVAKEFIATHLDQIARTDRAPVSASGQEPPVGKVVEFEAPDRTYLLTTLANGTLQQIVPLKLNYRMSDDYKARYGRTVIRGDLWKGFHQDMGNVAKEGSTAFGNGKKPIRLIKQLIRWANNSPDAVIVDFFAGSGTTSHAVMAMNAEDGGNRVSIAVTNNEIGKDDMTALRKKGRRPGDPAWEKFGVHEGFTKPRVTKVATDPDVQANVEFFKLTYESPLRVSSDREFPSIAPLLWIRAGSRGRRIEDVSSGWDVADTYGVLRDLNQTDRFVRTVAATADVGVVYVITDEDRLFESVVRELPEHVEPVRLYDAYLRNFEIEMGRNAL